MAIVKYITPDGAIVPDTADIKIQTQQEWKDTFGEDLPLADETPQGMMIGQETAVRSEVVANNAVLANQINPNIAGGVFLDDIWALTGGKRRQATFTTVYNVVLGGVADVTIPSGSRRALASNPDALFELISTVQLDAAGKGLGTFQAVDQGAIAAPANDLTVPVPGYTSVGWETSNNPEPGIIGRSSQSDLSARRERKQTLALQGRSTAEAVYSNVRALPEVNSLSFRENVENFTQVIDGISLVEHSVWACVDGGSDADVAAALYRSKSGGANWNGAVSVALQDPISGQRSTVKFDRPAAVPVMARFTVSAGNGTGDPVALIRSAVIAYSLGQTDEEGFVLGEDVSPFELAAAANLSAPGIFIRNVEVAFLNAVPAWQSASIPIGLNQKATISPGNILVTIV